MDEIESPLQMTEKGRRRCYESLKDHHYHLTKELVGFAL